MEEMVETLTAVKSLLLEAIQADGDFTRAGQSVPEVMAVPQGRTIKVGPVQAATPAVGATRKRPAAEDGVKAIAKRSKK